MKISLSTLRKTIDSLERALEVYDKYENSGDEKLKISLKESVIQSFEVSYEMSKKMILRYLKKYGEKTIEQESIQSIFRLGQKSGIISSARDWFEYRENRNNTIHIYDLSIAEDVFLTAKNFLEDARFLLKKLEEKIET